MSTQTVPVVVIDDDSMVRGWVRMVLEGSEFRIAGEASNAAEAIDLVPRRAPELVLVDFRLGAELGTELVRELRHRGLAAPVVVMTANPEPGLNEAARESGAQGTVLKTGRPIDVVSALREVLAGRPSFDPRHPPRPAGTGPLTPREREVVRLVAEGRTNREIAAQLGIGSETVKTLLARSFAKLGVRRRAEAVAAAHERGLL